MIFLNANARIDGSNNFGDRANDKILPIWSVSASFDPAQLGFIRQATWIDRFILKASYGFQGNMLSDQSPVMIIKKGPMDDYFGEFTSTVSRNPNPDLKWEKTTSVNLGFDIAFLNNRLELEGDVYFKRIHDQEHIHRQRLQLLCGERWQHLQQRLQCQHHRTPYPDPLLAMECLRLFLQSHQLH